MNKKNKINNKSFLILRLKELITIGLKFLKIVKFYVILYNLLGEEMR